MADSMSWFGWNSISESELRAAQRIADASPDGVRDELGLSAIHFLYADRLFPGTSTQMTKLRYVMFVAAAYEYLRQYPRDGVPFLNDVSRRARMMPPGS